MSIESQKLLEILQYICFTGLILSGLAVFVIPDFRKKILLLFMMFIFITILSFVFYAGILLFITNMIFIFVFAALFLLARRAAVTSNKAETGLKKNKFIMKAAGAAGVVLICSGLGYIIIDISRGYFPESKKGGEVLIAGLEDITVSIFNTYNSVIIFLIAAVLATFIGLTLFSRSRQKDREV